MSVQIFLMHKNCT